MRIHYLASELPTIRGPAEKLAIEGPQILKAQSLEGKQEKKKTKKGGKGELGGEDQNVIEAVPDAGNKQKRKNVEEEEEELEGGFITKASRKYLKQNGEEKVMVQKEEVARGDVSIEQKAASGVGGAGMKKDRLQNEGGLEANHEAAEGIPTETGRKRKKRSRNTPELEAGAEVEGQPSEKSPKTKKKKRRKGGDEADLEGETTEKPLQLEWFQEAATAGNVSAAGLNAGLDGLPKERQTGEVLSREKKKKQTKEAEAGDGEGCLTNVRTIVNEEKVNPTMLEKAAAGEETEAGEGESSSESASEGEAPAKEKKVRLLFERFRRQDVVAANLESLALRHCVFSAHCSANENVNRQSLRDSRVSSFIAL